MGKTVEQRLQLMDDVFSDGAAHGVMLLDADDETLSGRTVHVNGRDLVNFGSCSYLGLEMDPRLRDGVIDAVTRYGTQFSSSRSYMSAPPYAQLQQRLRRLFGAPVMVASSTSLGHVAVIPTIVSEDDAIVLDQQVHHSVQSAANQARVQGTHVELIRHSRLDMLEERLQELRKRHRRVWYMADGVYSMFADFAPLAQLSELLDRYPQLYLYVDDSHGMSWAGPHGRGYTLSQMPIHDRLVVAASLNKAFACAGGAFVFPSEEMCRKVTVVGGPMVFSGPVQPPMLGAAIASADIHLSPEIVARQAALAERVTVFNQLADEAGLPLISHSTAPIRYVGVGLPRLAYRVAQRMLDDGLYVNVAPFPGVPMKQGGIRTPLTLHHTPADVEHVVASIARHLPAVLREEGSSIEQLAEAFRIDVPANWRDGAGAAATPSPQLRLEHATDIDELDVAEWDQLLGGRGSFNADGLRFMQRAFRGHDRPEDNWSFHYFVVRDEHRRPVLATFFIATLVKDDMLSPAAISERVERHRRLDPYFLTSRALMMGSLLSEGDHLYLDRKRDWRGALTLLLDAVNETQRHEQADQLVLRDFDAHDEELGKFIRAQGFAPVQMLDSWVLDGDFHDDERWLAGLTSRSRHHQREQVLPFEGMVRTELFAGGGPRPGREQLEQLYHLYRNVEERGLDLNVFPLPFAAFEQMLDCPGWEWLVSYPSDPAAGTQAIAFGAHFVGADHYSPMVIGLDYEYLDTHHIYRVALLKMIRRAQQLRSPRVLLGMGAPLEKHRFGAVAQPRLAFVRADDHYHADVLAQIEADARGVRLDRRDQTRP